MFEKQKKILEKTVFPFECKVFVEEQFLRLSFPEIVEATVTNSFPLLPPILKSEDPVIQKELAVLSNSWCPAIYLHTLVSMIYLIVVDSRDKKSK